MKYLKIFTNFLEVTRQLSDGAMGKLFRAMLLYAQDGTETDLKGKEGVAWIVAKQHIDRETEAYENKVKHLQRGRSVSREKESVWKQEKEKENEKEKEKDSLSLGSGPGGPGERERKPTLDEVMEFSQTEGLQVDVTYFYNYYEANGWHIGKQPIRDWRAALIAWARKAPAQKSGSRETFLALMEQARMEEAKQL